MTAESSTALAAWYLSQCDGEWEHSFGVHIETLDNPGWEVVVDLTDTTFSRHKWEDYKYDHGDRDWIFCRRDEKTFRGAGDPTKLTVIIDYFLNAGRPDST